LARELRLKARLRGCFFRGRAQPAHEKNTFPKAASAASFGLAAHRRYNFRIGSWGMSGIAGHFVF